MPKSSHLFLILLAERLWDWSLRELIFSPFFGEEFQFNIPRDFRFISFYIHDRDRSMKTNKVIGKVSVQKEALNECRGKDQWYSLKAVDADSEVQVNY